MLHVSIFVRILHVCDLLLIFANSTGDRRESLASRALNAIERIALQHKHALPSTLAFEPGKGELRKRLFNGRPGCPHLDDE